MRANSTKLRWACVIMAALTFLVLGGCGEQAQDDGTTVIEDLEPDTGADGTAATEIPEDAETLADVVGSFTMPSSFRMTVEQGEAVQMMAMKMDGEQATKMRVESETPEGTEVMVMDFEGGEMFSYNTTSKEGFSVPVSADEAGDPPAPWEEYDESAKVTGSEEINGVDTWVVETEQPGAEGETAVTTVWIGKEDGLMRQIKQGEETVSFTVSDVNSVPESEFEVPDDVEISEMPMGGPMGEGGAE